MTQSRRSDFLDAKHKIAVIGLGYVGLPLAIAFAGKWDVIGFDINSKRIQQLKAGFDHTGEASSADLNNASKLSFTDQDINLEDCNIYIVTVPTPVDFARQPDLGPLNEASTTVGKWLKPSDFVIFESTVYPGVTRQECVSVLEAVSGLKMLENDEDKSADKFFVGYSPERINPGDPSRRLTDIVKVTSGCTENVAAKIDSLYASVIAAGTHLAPSIEVAEAAKVIENTQRDVNIALMNELAILFDILEIDTSAVLDAAKTKWNFLSFSPGFVGGHCIGVDPYYLTHAAAKVGYHPEMILAGRRINDTMPDLIAKRLLKLLFRSKINLSEAKILILGITFKENCPDTRNSKVFDLVKKLEEFGFEVECFDPLVCDSEASLEADLKLVSSLEKGCYDAAVVCVPHREFISMGLNEIKACCRPEHIIFDVKNAFRGEGVDGRL